MIQENNEYLIFNASHIISIELKSDIASNCKLRSNFVHEQLIETKHKLSGNPLLLRLCNKGLKVFNQDSQALVMSHSIHRISYTACDRSSCQFAIVARSTENGNSQFCHILRMCTAEEADTVNRYIGSLFKDLNQKRKNKKSENLSKHIQTSNKPPIEDNSTEVFESPAKRRSLNNVYDDLDTRLKRISTPHIDELVSEKHYVRRLSLCIPSPSIEYQAICKDLSSSNMDSSLEKKMNNSMDGNEKSQPVQPIENKPMLRKKSDYKSNKISAVMERLSFRASRDMSSTDILKSGSPVVALKEQLESFDRYAEKVVEKAAPTIMSNNMDDNRTKLVTNITNSTVIAKKPVMQLPQKDGASNSWKIGALTRKNSAPIPLEQVINNVNINEEQPPVPPVRINSLRNPVNYRPTILMNESPLVKYKGENSSHAISALVDQDDHLSSITTPSSCGDNNGDSTTYDMQMSNQDMSYQSGQYRSTNTSKINFSTSFNENQYRPSSHNTITETHNSNLPLNYFKNFSKDETTDYLINKEMGSFILRNSASHQGCFALSVKVSDISVSHYIVQSSSVGFQIKGLDKIWPSLHSLITHLSVIPEMLPCTLYIQPPGLPRKLSTPSFLTDTHTEAPLNITNNIKKHTLPQSKSAEEEYQLRMRQFLNDSSIPGQEQYQQLSDFSSMIANFDLN